MTGRTAMTAPMLSSACTTTQVVMPTARSMPKRSGARSAAMIPATPITTKPQITEAAPSMPSSSATIAKMKSVWANGRKPHFALARPTPLHPPLVMARLQRLVADTGRIRPRVEEGEETVAAPWRGKHHRCGKPAAGGARTDEMAEGRSGEEQHGKDRDADYEHGTEVRLEHEEAGEDGRHEKDRTHRDLCVLDGPARPSQEIGGEEHDRELEQLRRLHGERPHTEPTGRPLAESRPPE